MTNTKCPSCNVMLDLRKFATGACEWCGERLPHDMVTHARERVAAREEGHRRIEPTAHGEATVSSQKTSSLVGLIPFMGIGVLLVLVGYLGVTAFQNGHFRPDTPQLVAAVLLGLLAAAGVVWRIFFNHRSGVRS